MSVFKTLLENVAMESNAAIADLSELLEEETDELANTFDALTTPEANPKPVTESDDAGDDDGEDDSILAAAASEVAEDAIDSIGGVSDDDAIDLDAAIIDDESGDDITAMISDGVDEAESGADGGDSLFDGGDDDSGDDGDDDPDEDGIDLTADDLKDIDPDDVVGDAFTGDDALILDDVPGDIGDVTDAADDAADGGDDDLDDLIESAMNDL